MFFLKQLLKPLILPPMPWFIMLVIAAIFWRRRWGKVLLWVTLCLIFISHNPYVGRELYYGLESRYAPLIDPARAEPYDAIVVLMAGTIPAGGLVPFPTVTGPLFHRLDEVRRLYRIRPKPIVVSGGHVSPFTHPYNENQIACDYLILWGVPKDQIVSELESRDTFESAIEVEKIVRQKGWKRYLLVTSAVHMPRSMLVFSSLAPEPIAAPGDFTYVGGPSRIFLNEEAADRIADATHEYLGMLNYRWRLRFYQKTESANGTAR